MKALLAFFIFLPSMVFCQSIGRQVIASTGTISGGTISSSTVGPSILFTTSTADTLLLTQGFQQPAGNNLLVEIIILPATCFSPSSGSVELLISGCTGSYEVLWENQTSETLIEDLPEGTYSFSIQSGGCAYSGEAVVGFSNDCGDVIPNVITLNNDGANETWIVPELYLTDNATNTVEIFNRWGQSVWSSENYNNMEIVWVGNNKDGQQLSAGTYFYKITLPSETKTGYIELFK